MLRFTGLEGVEAGPASLVLERCVVTIASTEDFAAVAFKMYGDGGSRLGARVLVFREGVEGGELVGVVDNLSNSKTG